MHHIKRVRCICCGKTCWQTECDGQTGCTAHILDGIIDKIVRQIFERMKSVPKNEMVNARYREKMEERKQLLQFVRAEHAKAAAELEILKAEIINVLRGESIFSKELLSGMVAEAEAKVSGLQEQLDAAQTAYKEGQAVMDALNARYADIISWTDLYSGTGLEARKRMVNCLMKRVEICRDCKLHIGFNIGLEQFSLGKDIVTIAA